LADAVGDAADAEEPILLHNFIVNCRAVLAVTLLVAEAIDGDTALMLC
jgi:hypothetical protein